jgi:hypothetical protein
LEVAVKTTFRLRLTSFSCLGIRRCIQKFAG